MSMTLPQRLASPTDRSLLSLMASVFTVFLVTGAALPALPLYIHDNLGFGPFMVGLVTGTQFAASLLSRLWSGTVADRQGPKHAVTAGLVMAASAGLLPPFPAGHRQSRLVDCDIAGGPRAPRRRRKLHHDRRAELVPGAGRPR